MCYCCYLSLEANDTEMIGYLAVMVGRGEKEEMGRFRSLSKIMKGSY